MRSGFDMRLVLINGQYCREQSVLNAEDFPSLEITQSENTVSLSVAPNAIIQKPIYFIFHTTQSSESILKISVGDNAQCTIIEEYNSEVETEYHAISKTELTIEHNAKTHYFILHNENKYATRKSAITITQHQQSQLTLHPILLGGKIVEQQVTTHMRGCDAHAQLSGLYHAKQKQSHTLKTQWIHHEKNAFSRQLCKGVANDEACALFDGTIIVCPSAAKTTAHLKNNNLLLSNQANIQTKPILVIDHDDVVCTHGATVGCLDEDAIFYLRARGISENAARDLLTQSFLNEVLDSIVHDEIRQYCYEKCHAV